MPVVANWNDLPLEKSHVPVALADSLRLTRGYVPLPSVGDATTNELFPARPVPLMEATYIVPQKAREVNV
jgi:hypothetical protein